MRYEYKVIDITEDKENDKSEIMRAMSLKKLQKNQTIKNYIEQNI